MDINHDFQNVINHIRTDLTGIIGIADENGRVIACSDETRIGSTVTNKEGVILRTEGNNYILFSENLADSPMVLNMLRSMIELLFSFKDNHHVKEELLRDIALGRVAKENILSRLNEAGITNHKVRIVATMQGLHIGEKDFYRQCSAWLLNHASGCILKSTSSKVTALLDFSEDKKIPDILPNMDSQLRLFEKQVHSQVIAGLCNPFDDLIDLEDKCREAEHCLEAGLCETPCRSISWPQNIGLSGIAASLNKEESEFFLQNMHADTIWQSLDEEDFYTINQLFDNNLSISDTAKCLFINRNTLIYRINKIQKAVNLDLRRFSDAAELKMAMMVHNHLRWLNG